MSLSTTINYDTASNFSFDANLIEIVGAQAQLKDQRPANATFHASYSSLIDAEWGDGVLTGTAYNGAAIIGGKLDLTGGAAVKYVEYSAASNADFLQALCIRCNWTPNYSGTPTNSQVLFALVDATGSLNNLVEVWHDTGGHLRFAIFDSVGATIVSASLGVFSVTAGQTYEVEFNMDITNGDNRLFIDGTQIGSTDTSTGTRAAANLIRVGANHNVALNTNFKISDFTIFSQPQHTANFTSPAPVSDTILPTSSPTIRPASTTLADAFVSLAETTTVTSGSEIRYQVVVDGSPQYWNGSAWVASDGSFAQSNTLADVNTNAGSLNISNGVTLTIQALLVSDGTAQAQIASNTYEYSFYAQDPSSPTKCIVYFFLKDLTGSSLTTGSFKVSQAGGYDSNGNIIATSEVSGTLDSRGYGEVAVVEGVSSNTITFFELSYTDADSISETMTFEGIVPSQATALLTDFAKMVG